MENNKITNDQILVFNNMIVEEIEEPIIKIKQINKGKLKIDNTKDKIKLEIIDREESDDVKYDFYYNKELNIGELSNKSYDEAQKSNTLLHNKILLLGIFLFVKYNN